MVWGGPGMWWPLAKVSMCMRCLAHAKPWVIPARGRTMGGLTIRNCAMQLRSLRARNGGPVRVSWFSFWYLTINMSL